jgi:hypothetical protein
MVAELEWETDFRRVFYVDWLDETSSTNLGTVLAKMPKSFAKLRLRSAACSRSLAVRVPGCLW